MCIVLLRHLFDVNFSLSVTAQSHETNPSEPGDVVTPTAVTTFAVPVTVRPVADAPAISGSSTVNEDGIVNPADQSITAGVPFGTDGDLALTL